MTVTRALKNSDTQPKLGEHLQQLGLVTADQIEAALHEKARSHKMIGTILVELGFLRAADLTAALSARSGMPAFDPLQTILDPVCGKKIPQAVAAAQQLAALYRDEDSIYLAMTDPYDVLALDQARRYLGAESMLVPVIVTAAMLADIHDLIYGYESDLENAIQLLQSDRAVSDFSAADMMGGFRHPMVRLVNIVLLDAVKQGASDIHIAPEAGFIRLRQRIDGVLIPVASLHKDFWSALSHRLKIMAGMNIADKLSPQDGRFSMSVAGRAIDFRVSTLPGAQGENIVVRILDQSRGLLSLGQLGFNAPQQQAMHTMLKKPEGLVIITGPTGSGKTTTLYALLQQLAQTDVNIMTLEDPIEYQVPLVRQTQMHEATGFGFAEGVRAILRQDPDVILIGEIRDAETAQMAMRAAMTGHLVLSTMHTRDSFSVLPRLHDLGIAPATLADNINGVVAQRLVRRLCTHCKQPYAASMAEQQLLSLATPAILQRAVGCDQCRQTGYKGRLPLAEILTVSPPVAALITSGLSRYEWHQRAAQGGFSSLQQEAVAQIMAGNTSVQAVMDVLDLKDKPYAAL